MRARSSPSRWLFASLLCAAGCTPTRKDVLEWNRGSLDKLRQRVVKVAASLPPPGRTALYAAKGPVDPRPVLDSRLDNRVNTDLLMANELDDSHATASPRWDGYHLRRILALMDGRAEEQAELSRRDPQFRDEVKHVLGLRYLAVVRTVREGSPAGASMTLELFLVDLATGSIRAAITTTAPRMTALQDAEAALASTIGGELH